MFITPAYAQFGGGAGGTDTIVQFLPFVLIFVVMYFLIIRPQRQRAKAHQDMIKGVRRGDTIVTTGGLIGKVAKVVDDAEVQVEIADGIKVRISRAAISEIRSKGEPAKDEG